LVDSGHSIIGCHYDGHGVAITLVEGSGKKGYHILENWYKSEPTGLGRVVDKCDELFYYENIKTNRKVEIFLNNLPTLEKALGQALKIHPSPVKIASVSHDEAFTLISSLLVEQKISLSEYTLPLEKELKNFDPLLIDRNHQVYSLFNSIAQAESNRLTVPDRSCHVSGYVRRTRLSS
jgi:hypothetical protein